MPQTRKKRNQNKSKGLKKNKNNYKKSQKINKRKLRGGGEEVYKSPRTWDAAVSAGRTIQFPKLPGVLGLTNRKSLTDNKKIADDLKKDVDKYSKKYHIINDILNVRDINGNYTKAEKDIQQKVADAWKKIPESERLSFDTLNELIARYLALDDSSQKCGDDELIQLASSEFDPKAAVRFASPTFLPTCRDLKEIMYVDLKNIGIELSKMLDDTYNDLYIDSIRGTKKNMKYMKPLIAKIFVYSDKSDIKSERKLKKDSEDPIQGGYVMVYNTYNSLLDKYKNIYKIFELFINASVNKNVDVANRTEASTEESESKTDMNDNEYINSNSLEYFIVESKKRTKNLNMDLSLPACRTIKERAFNMFNTKLPSEVLACEKRKSEIYIILKNIYILLSEILYLALLVTHILNIIKPPIQNIESADNTDPTEYMIMAKDIKDPNVYMNMAKDIKDPNVYMNMAIDIKNNILDKNQDFNIWNESWSEQESLGEGKGLNSVNMQSMSKESTPPPVASADLKSANAQIRSAAQLSAATEYLHNHADTTKLSKLATTDLFFQANKLYKDKYIDYIKKKINECTGKTAKHLDVATTKTQVEGV